MSVDVTITFTEAEARWLAERAEFYFPAGIPGKAREAVAALPQPITWLPAPHNMRVAQFGDRRALDMLDGAVPVLCFQRHGSEWLYDRPWRSVTEAEHWLRGAE